MWKKVTAQILSNFKEGGLLIEVALTKEVKEPILLKSLIICSSFTQTKEINLYFLVKWAFSLLLEVLKCQINLALEVEKSNRSY